MIILNQIRKRTVFRFHTEWLQARWLRVHHTHTRTCSSLLVCRPQTTENKTVWFIVRRSDFNCLCLTRVPACLAACLITPLSACSIFIYLIMSLLLSLYHCQTNTCLLFHLCLFSAFLPFFYFFTIPRCSLPSLTSRWVLCPVIVPDIKPHLLHFKCYLV